MANRLSRSLSPYLLQHADNPVDWWEWDEDAFSEARRRDVPVLLSVGYAACHWCHVMAHESFEDDEVARALNDGFVAVKVDREERPDVDAVYMAATTAASQLDNSTWMAENPWAPVALGIVVSGIVHTGKMAARPVVNVGTAGLGGPVVSTIEDGASIGLSLIAILAPVLVVVALALLAWLLIWMALRVRRWRASRGHPAYQS